MTARMETLPGKKLAGMRLKISLADNRTAALWGRFMPRRKEIANRVGQGYYSIQVYDQPPDFRHFSPRTEFETWAAVEVSGFDPLPAGMEPHLLHGGLYAVFLHRGDPSSFPQTLNYIFGTWLPQSGYALDDREHFQYMNEKYNPNDKDAEEEVWIPVKPAG